MFCDMESSSGFPRSDSNDVLNMKKFSCATAKELSSSTKARSGMPIEIRLFDGRFVHFLSAFKSLCITTALKGDKDGDSTEMLRQI